MITTGYESIVCPVIEAVNGQHMRSFFPQPAVSMPIAALLGRNWCPEEDIRRAIEDAMLERGDTRDFWPFTSTGIVEIYPYEGSYGDQNGDDEPYDVWQEQWERAMCD